MSFIIWISILVARELAPAVSLTSASRLGILRRGPFVVTNTGSFSADQKPRKVLLGPTVGSWRDRCSRSAGHSGHPPAPQGSGECRSPACQGRVSPLYQRWLLLLI